MKFRLYYRGQLKPNGSPKHKQTLRQAFHPQLKELWNHQPLNELAKNFLDPNNQELNVLVNPVGGWMFASVINTKHHLVAALDITMLRQEDPGSLIAKGGDIDNRLKTLFDALAIPNADQIPNSDVPREDEQPIHCLLEDDRLITGLNVTVDRLLGAETTPDEVLLIIGVDIAATRGTFKNLVFSL